MAIQVFCNIPGGCGRELDKPGAVMVGPPLAAIGNEYGAVNDLTIKYHACADCYTDGFVFLGIKHIGN